MTEHRYSFTALLKAMNMTIQAASVQLGISGRTRNLIAQRGGLTEKQADRYAVRAGLHPYEVWQDWFDHAFRACAHPDCAERFVPTAPHQRFCSHRCRRRFNERRARELNLPSAENKRENRRRYYEQYGDYERARQRRYDRARRTPSAPQATDGEVAA